MTISFNNIPVGILTPGNYVEFDNSNAIQGLVSANQRILVIGQRLTTGTVDANIPTQITRAEQAEEFFGRGSMLADMFKALKKINPNHESFAIALDDNGAGAAAAGDIIFSGAPTAAGTLNVYIAGQRVQVGVSTADTAAAVATKLAAAIITQTDLPVTAVVDGGAAEKVNITARHKGELGNSIDVRINYHVGESTPKGLVSTITGLNGGTANPDVTGAIAAMGDDQYQTIIQPYVDASNLILIDTEMERRFGPLVAKEGICYTAASGTFSTLSTLGGTLNSQHITILGLPDVPTAPWVAASVYGAVATFYGAIDPARPLQTLVLADILPPAREKRLTRAERDILLSDGIATFTVNSGGLCLIERAVTTYKTNAGGLPDASYRDVSTPLTLFFLRFSLRARISQKYPRHKLADDGTKYGEGQAVVTPAIIRDELIVLFKEWEEIGLVEDIKQFKAELVVERDPNDPNRINALIPTNVVNQFRTFAASIQFIL